MRFLCVLLMTGLTFVLGDDLLTVATNNGCGKIAELIQSAGLADVLKAAQGVTLFAPNDDAVRNIPSDVMTQLRQNATLLASVLKFHVVSQVARAGDVTNDLLLPTLADGGERLRMNSYRWRERIFHSVNPAITIYDNHTVVTAEGSRVVKTDLEADNGVVHVLNKVIYPLPTSSLPLTIAFNKNLDSLAYMAYEANLTEFLSGGDFTVFAPSNAALDKLPGQLYNDLLMNVTRLRDLLLTHVVKGVVFSAGLRNGQSLTNLQGTQLPIKVGASGISVNNVQVISADLSATNGVIHIIDTVIMPN